MAILKNIEGWWFKLVPSMPDKYDPKKPTWNFQARTTDKAQVKEWKENHLTVKAVREDKDDEESKILYWKCIMGKKVTNSDGKPAQPVSINSSKGDVDPASLGNGSIVNVRLYQYPYTFEGKSGIANSLQSIQLVKHIVYERPAGEDFDEVETETVAQEVQESEEETPKTPVLKPAGAPKAVDTDGEY